MKRMLYLFLILVFIPLAACSSSDETANKVEKSDDKTVEQAEENEEEPKEKDAKEKGVEVDKGLLNVEVTLPPSMFEGEDIDAAIAEAKADGVKEVTKNDDGSLTYKMSKSKHKEMMKEMKTSISQSVNEMKTSGDYASIKDITFNDSFTEFTVIVDKEAFENSFDGFAAMGLGFSGMMYQLFDGADPDEYKVSISIADEATQEVFDEVVYPDALEEQE